MIKKQKDGTYVVVVSSRDKFGKKIKRQKSKISSLPKARRIERELLDVIVGLRIGFAYSGKTFGYFLDNAFLPYCERECNDAEALAKSVRKWCKKILKVKIDLITHDDLAEILRVASDFLAYSSTKKIRTYLNRIFRFACDSGFKNNPTVGLIIPKPKTEVQAKVLNREEVNLLLRKSKDLMPTWYLIWAFHLFTGVRSGEGYALLKTDVDLEGMLISINKSWSSKKGTKSTKNGEWRLVPISESLKPIIVELLSAKDNGKHLLPHPTKWTKGEQAKILGNFCTGLGITRIKFHDLRATFITHMFATGASIAEVQSIVGHKELRTTQVYLRLSGINIKGATNKLNFVLPSEQSDKVVNLHQRVEVFGT